MPNIELIPVELFENLDPYHYLLDNRPISALVERVDAVNSSVDNATSILDASVGSAGSLSARLDQSINDDGSLKTAAVDEALHSIEEHEDTDDYVRMTSAERSKLAGVASSSTSLIASVGTGPTGGVTIVFDNETMYLGHSDTIAFRNDAGVLRLDYKGTNIVHHYGVEPTTEDDENFVVEEFVSGTLRVYVNGVRIPESPTSVYYPVFSGGEVSEWVSLNFTEDSSEGGEFSTSVALDSSDVIFCDFDSV